MSFWQAKTKIRREDKLFSDYIRARDGWRCSYKFKCMGVYNFLENKGGLTNSHFIKRRHESVRFDPENCDAACRPCHSFVEDKTEGRRALENWKLTQLGTARFNALRARKYAYKKKDPMLDLLYVKELLKTL